MVLSSLYYYYYYHYHSFIRYCVDNNAYTGVELPKRPGDDGDDGAGHNNLIAALQGFHIGDNDDDNDHDDDIEENRAIDRENWI